MSPVRLIREGLATVLGRRPQVAAIETVPTAEAALELAISFGASLVLLDLSDGHSPAAARQLGCGLPSTPVLGFAASENDDDVLGYAEAGIVGFVSRDASIDDLFDAINRTSRGEILCSPRFAGVMFRRLALLANARPAPDHDLPLTSREREIARLIDGGLSNKEIAQRLRIGVSTVKNHVHRILEKLHVSRRGEAAALVRSAGVPRGLQAANQWTLTAQRRSV